MSCVNWHIRLHTIAIKAMRNVAAQAPSSPVQQAAIIKKLSDTKLPIATPLNLSRCLKKKFIMLKGLSEFNFFPLVESRSALRGNIYDAEQTNRWKSSQG